ncbi:pyridoxamine 5'-phosphate oxidase family protein [Actinotalea fermentans]|uniref:General stress protein n=1 Tax=Actinotalea fermentans TaxID=43671 RepID=A0A511YVB3_9CELL|nr:pyridoxamine 5'-phosphate oxidase family protein [Actinotalea fermentans]GEN79119.1 general stress protein [Actinotalea fermentans]
MSATPDHLSADEGTRKVADLVKGHRIAMLTSIAADGTLVSRPMALQEIEFDGDLWFFAERSSRKVANVAANAQVNVTVGSATTWVSLTGTAVVVDNPERKRELWNEAVKAWYPDGPDDDGLVLIKVVADSAEYWDTPGRLATLVSYAKARVTGQRYEGGENARVEME